MSVIEAGSIRAAVAPWAHRAAISTGMDGASAQSSEVSPNSAIPTTYARFAPTRSETFPAHSSNAAKNRV